MPSRPTPAPDPAAAATRPKAVALPSWRAWPAAGLLALGLLLILACLPLAWAASGPVSPVIELSQAAFSTQAPRGRAAEDTTVHLPDLWVQRGLSRGGLGYYRLGFDLPEAPRQPWAVQFTHLGVEHEVVVNGEVISTQLPELNTPGPHLRVPRPTLLPIPAALLQAGHNELRVTVDLGTVGGLDAPRIGPADALQGRQRRLLMSSIQLPVMLNIFGTTVALFMLLMWVRRPGERQLGVLGTAGVLLSLRNIVYFSLGGVPEPLLDWLCYCTDVTGLLLLWWLARDMSRPHEESSPAFLRTLLGCGALLLLGGAAVNLTDSMSGAPQQLTPLVYLLGLPALLTLGRATFQPPAPSPSRLPKPGSTLIGLLMLWIASVHDYAYWQGWTAVHDRLWSPYALPIALAVFAWIAVRRLAAALSEVERLNVELEQRVLERTLALERAHATKTRLLAAASHDLRQPVVTIGLLIDLLRDQLHEPRQRKMIDRVDAAVESMENLLKGLLDLSRLESGTVQPRWQDVALQPLFEAIASHEGEAAQHKRIRLRVRPTRLAVRSDPVLLEQIVRNLVSNAVRYTDHGGVLVGARQRGDQVLIQVWDSGDGIAPEQQHRIFDEFVQLAPDQGQERSLAVSRGMGLGLSIVQRACQVLQHTLSLRSVREQGSCFMVQALRAGALEAAPAPPPPNVGALRGLSIAVVEDEEVVRSALEQRLSAWGAQVHAFEGLRVWRQHLAMRPRGHSGIALLVTDQRLRDGNGLEAVEALHAYAGPIPALVITGDTAPDDLARLARCGLPVLHKPFRADALLEAITLALEPRQAPRPT